MGKPEYVELDRMGNSASSRYGRRVTNFLLHTQEGNGTAESLANYLNNPANGVSYHYTVRDGVVVDVVDTNLASWSVLDANSFTINLCFAGSRSAWTREDWLRIRDDIRIAAWLAVQDARKYGFATTVIAPPYRRGEGISDHRYVTDCLGIGDHTDVGPGFPWDVFARDVQAAIDGRTTESEEDDMPSIDDIAKAVLETRLTRPDGKPGETVGNVLSWIDQHTAQLVVEQLGPGSEAIRGPVVEPKRWTELGNRTQLEALAALLESAGIPPRQAK
ncbi:N-acetylmuramoyl-L-alanine amidase [Nocardia sp. SC052]|uniref:N-acetylmuramoyl-L-alanine amidase n=1 Tax=Nocardia sichangensis TaxID=3385975 RepID=UPI0039A24A9C